ncbi:YraN family protein [Agromyces archimandritae]|uniref:UPF0102 protein G127AT_14680 n=1 Tax=Agromyces archimandritae TaxID=2781962 RepID=A0A975INE7_9MICO|nr:YraN family protein [Agromyces archimandritae]QTX04490.1 YraN family protein [Agromyces archimandritae]
MAHKDELGRHGEELAVRHLTAAGLTILDRNWRCRIGELDIVAMDAGETVFVEVKTRSGAGYGHPFDAITPVKLARIRRLASAWCEAREHATRRRRVDAIAVTAPPGRPATIEHLRGVS